ncbi:MAG: WcaF family extracellular polysaccharide biosynthesis acetyltransferase [Ginsengibacter sp.]
MQDLSKFNNSWYKPGSVLKRSLWYITNILFFKSGLFPVSSVKCNMLRFFNATVGTGVIIKPNVNIKYPWFLVIRNNVWIGEGVWIDNLAQVTIHNNVCISQGAFLLTGNHNYSKISFDLFVKPIILEDGVWIGARSIVCPGVIAHNSSILQAGSVAVADLEEQGIYAGNPAVKIKLRQIKTF